MKKIVIITSLLFLAACTQNDDFDNANAEGTGFSKITYGSEKSSGTAILSFENMEAYETKVNELENSVDSWDDNFVATWDYLSDDDLNNKEEELNFDDEKPLTDFEKQNNFYSLRNKYYAEEEAWLNHEELDDKSDPNNMLTKLQV